MEEKHLLVYLFIAAVLGGERFRSQLTDLVRIGLNLHLLVVEFINDNHTYIKPTVTN